MLGIEDTMVALAYILCIASTVLCIVYSIVNRDRGDDEITPQDIKWVKTDKEVEEKL